LTQQLTQNRQQKGHIMKEITDITKQLKVKKKEIENIKHEEELLSTLLILTQAQNFLAFQMTDAKSGIYED